LKLAELFESGKFVVTAELGPPKGVDTNKMLQNADLLKGRVDAVNITDQQSSVMRLGSLASAHLVKQHGLEPIYQLTCRDRNRIALQSDLLSASVLGIENILCITGDYVSLGDHPEAKPVFDLDSVSLLRAAKMLKNGYDMAGNKLLGAPSFCLGAVVNPTAEPLELQVLKLEKKVVAGAEFIQTQAVYDPERFKEFVKQVKHLKIPIMVGIVPLRSASMARFMNKHVAGIHVPEELIERMEKTRDKTGTSIEICVELIKEMKPFCQGVHIMAIGWEKIVPKILDACGL